MFKRKKAQRPLTIKQQRFVDEWVQHNNATLAAKNAGYGNNAAVIGCQLLKHPLISQIIRKRAESKSDADDRRARVTADWVLLRSQRQYEHLSFQLADLIRRNKLDVTELFDSHGALKSPLEWPDAWREKQMIKSLKIKEIFEYDADSKSQVFVGYMKELTITDHKSLEATFARALLDALRNLGEHALVRAYDPKSVIGPKQTIQVQVVYVNQENKPEEPETPVIDVPATEPAPEAEPEPEPAPAVEVVPTDESDAIVE